jgi:hypothetical protein
VNVMRSRSCLTHSCTAAHSTATTERIHLRFSGNSYILRLAEKPRRYAKKGRTRDPEELIEAV